MAIGRSSGGVLLLAGGFVAACAVAWAQSPAPEAAVSRTTQDAGLQWGPCPEFMPKGCEITIVCPRPGPTETMHAGQPTSSQRRST